MEKVRPWCGQPSDRGRLKNRTEQIQPLSVTSLLFHSRLKTFLFRKSFSLLPFSSSGLTHGPPGLFTNTSDHICYLFYLFFIFSLFYFLVLCGSLSRHMYSIQLSSARSTSLSYRTAKVRRYRTRGQLSLASLRGRLIEYQLRLG